MDFHFISPCGAKLYEVYTNKQGEPRLLLLTVKKAGAFLTKGMHLDCAQAFRALRKKLTLAG